MQGGRKMSEGGGERKEGRNIGRRLKAKERV